MITINATNFRKDLFNMLEQTITYNEPINIVTQKGNVVMMSEQDYRDMMETLHINSIPAMKEKIITGLNTPLEDCIDEDEVDL